MSRNPSAPGHRGSVFISALMLALLLSIDCANAQQQAALQQAQAPAHRVAAGNANTKTNLVLLPKRLVTFTGEAFPAFANAEKELDLAFQYLKGTQKPHSLKAAGRKAAFNFGPFPFHSKPANSCCAAPAKGCCSKSGSCPSACCQSGSQRTAQKTTTR